MNKKYLFLGVVVLVLVIGYVAFSASNVNKTDILSKNTKSDDVSNEATFKTEPKKVVVEPTLDDSVMKQQTATNTTPTENSASAPASDVKEFVLEAGSFYYKPNMIRVSKGDKVKITINSVSMMHDINIAEYNVHSSPAQSGHSVSVEFTADKAGNFEMFCSIGQHRANGQVGRFIVE